MALYFLFNCLSLTLTTFNTRSFQQQKPQQTIHLAVKEHTNPLWCILLMGNYKREAWTHNFKSSSHHSSMLWEQFERKKICNPEIKMADLFFLRPWKELFSQQGCFCNERSWRCSSRGGGQNNRLANLEVIQNTHAWLSYSRVQRRQSVLARPTKHPNVTSPSRICLPAAPPGARVVPVHGVSVQLQHPGPKSSNSNRRLLDAPSNAKHIKTQTVLPAPPRHQTL